MSGIHAGVMTTSLELIRAQHVPLKEVTESSETRALLGSLKKLMEEVELGGFLWKLLPEVCETCGSRWSSIGI